jgi:hypothetical protein
VAPQVMVESFMSTSPRSKSVSLLSTPGVATLSEDTSLVE